MWFCQSERPDQETSLQGELGREGVRFRLWDKSKHVILETQPVAMNPRWTIMSISGFIAFCMRLGGERGKVFLRWEL